MFCLTVSLVFSWGWGKKTTKSKKVKFTFWHSYVGADQRAPFMADRLEAFKNALRTV